MNHWETHLYTFAVALTQGEKIKPENLQGVRDKAIRHGHTEAECVFVEQNAQLYIAKGILGCCHINYRYLQKVALVGNCR